MEERKVVPGYEWLTVDREGNCWNTRFMRLYKGEIDKYGYKRINTRYKGERARCLVHRAVALAFIPNTDNLPTVNHKNAVKTDNKVENLEWATHQDQADHVKKLNLRETQFGEDTSNWKYPEVLIKQICQMIEDGYRNCDITGLLKVQSHLPSDIRNKRSWTHISKDYTFSTKRVDMLSHSAVVWICKQLESGITSAQVLNNAVNVNITLDRINAVKNKSIYRNISKNFSF